MLPFYKTCVAIIVVLCLVIHCCLYMQRGAKRIHYTEQYNFSDYVENYQIRLDDTPKKYTEDLIPQDATYLRYSVCNGFTNQRLAIVFGLIMAKELDRVLIIPNVLTEGMQFGENLNNIMAGGANQNTKPLGDWHDIDQFTDFLKRNNVKYVQEKDLDEQENYVVGFCDGLIINVFQCLQHLRTQHANDTRLHFDCPFPSVSISTSDIFQNSEFFLQALASLQPNERFSELVEKAQSRIEFLSGKNKYNFLHLRIEDDWVDHCDRWVDREERNNCFAGSFQLGENLLSKGVETDIPLYIATHWDMVNDSIKDAALNPLRQAGYEIITTTSVLNDMIDDLKREELGLKDYYLALGANKFIGNSVSTFTALVILERRSQGLWSGQYNGGNIPLSGIVPLYKLPWVFAYNSWSTPIDYLTKAAVRSALAQDSLKPYCMFTGDTNSSIYKWLEDKGVEMIIHRPEWLIKLTEINTKSAYFSKAQSHLYSNSEGIAGAFQRIDIPILEQLKQYDFIFYTDTDVFFMSQVMLDTFPQPLPKTLGMGPERVDIFPYNSGVALWNIQELRKTHDAFVNFILTQSDGLYFHGYGPVDQGALNQFYEQDIRGWKLPKKFLQKGYDLYLLDALIIHFHGPKPHHYLEYLNNGTCGHFVFGGLCELGLQNGFCFYIVEQWIQYTENEPITIELYNKCNSFIEQINKINKQFHVQSTFINSNSQGP